MTENEHDTMKKKTKTKMQRKPYSYTYGLRCNASRLVRTKDDVYMYNYIIIMFDFEKVTAIEPVAKAMFIAMF